MKITLHFSSLSFKLFTFFFLFYLHKRMCMVVWSCSWAKNLNRMQMADLSKNGVNEVSNVNANTLLTFWNLLSLLALLLAFFFFFFFNSRRFSSSSSSSFMAQESSKSIYDFTVKDIRGNDVNLNQYSGKVLIIVNVASQCGLTEANYKELNVLYDKYKSQGLEILAFPCNQFLGQEPGSNEEIQNVVCTRFKAEFPVFDKVEVNGKNAAPLYKFLKDQKGGIFGDGIKWNFTKFLVNKEGKVVERYAPTTSPLKIEKDIEKLLQSS